MSRYEQGLVAVDENLHAAQPSLLGPAALCGRGKLLVTRHGRFDPDHNRSCPDCARIVRDRQ